MAYFTTLLQHQVNDVWRKKIEQADAEMRLNTSGKEIRDYLNDRTTLCTVGFVIRRHIQKNNEALLDEISQKCGCQYDNLLKNLNVQWPEAFNLELAKELHRISAKKGISISRNTWNSYLSDGPAKMYSSTPFKVAFSLDMDVETTEELLVACGQDAYCFRNPEHFIYYYCQSLGRDWSTAQTLLARYKTGSDGDTYTANDASQGMTHMLRSDLKHIFLNGEGSARTDNELIEYMLQHQREFSGLSLTNRRYFLRMSEYLAILYPTYSRIVSSKNYKTGEVLETAEEVPVSLQEDGMPKLSELVRALFSTGGWLATTVSIDKKQRTASSVKRRQSSDNIEYKRAEIDEEHDRPFMDNVQYFVDSYSHHIDAIDRVFRRPANPGNVERRDVILFTYFFIRRYPELLMDEEMHGSELDRLTSLSYGDSPVDNAMDYVMEELYSITEAQMEDVENDCYDKGSDVGDYIDLFNFVLKQFGMKGMYMPNPWDRFITMSLFAEDPDFFTEAVLWNTIGDEEANDDSSICGEEENNQGIGPDRDSPMTEEFSGNINDPVRLTIGYPLANPSVIDRNGKKMYLHASLYRKKTGERIDIDRCCFIFGRRPQTYAADGQNYGFGTEDKGISRCHAMILFAEGAFYIADISSRTETWLGEGHLLGNKININIPDSVSVDYAYKLQNRDAIRVGSEEFVFELHSNR